MECHFCGIRVERGESCVEWGGTVRSPEHRAHFACHVTDAYPVPAR